MSKGHELTDGSLSTDYEIGDDFVLLRDCSTGGLCDLVKLDVEDGSSCPFFTGSSKLRHLHNVAISWEYLKPTPETKRKAQARKRKFTITSGDYIDSREFTREECERFCELAVECGFGRGEWVDNYQDSFHGYYLQIYRDELFWCGCVDFSVVSANNITPNSANF